jgi:membrane-associated protease RseP (regulator of RpoE activity)
MNWDTFGQLVTSMSKWKHSALALVRAVRVSVGRDRLSLFSDSFWRVRENGGRTAGDENINDPRGFLAKPRWQRLIIAAAGPFMNIVLAVSLLTGLYMVKYQRIAKPT